MGSENTVVKELAKQFNMSVEYILDDDVWGGIYENWTGFGILGNVAEDKADIGYAALYYWEDSLRFLDFSSAISRSGIMCIVPAPSLESGLLTPLLPFSFEMWLGTMILFVVSVLSSISISRILMHFDSEYKEYGDELQKVEYSFWNILRLFLVQSLPNTENKTVKYLFVLFIFSLILSAAYSSGLSSVMTIPRFTNAIRTVMDLANSGIIWYGTAASWTYTILKDERPQYKTLVKNFKYENENTLANYSRVGHSAFVVEYSISGSYAAGDYIVGDIVENYRLMREDMYWDYTLFMLRRNSVLLKPLDNLLLQLVASGLILYWESQATLFHMDFRVQNILTYYAHQTKEKQDGVIKLQWRHVEGAFWVLIIGYTLASVCFGYEILKYRLPQHKIGSYPICCGLLVYINSLFARIEEADLSTIVEEFETFFMSAQGSEEA